MGKMPQLMVAAIFCARGVVQEISTPSLAAAVMKKTMPGYQPCSIRR